MKSIVLAFIKLYGRLLSPLLGTGKCRFYPTCSHYARQAVETHGWAYGSWLAMGRILSCHPYSRRPFHDPVPEAIKPVPGTTAPAQTAKDLNRKEER